MRDIGPAGWANLQLPLLGESYLNNRDGQRWRGHQVTFAVAICSHLYSATASDTLHHPSEGGGIEGCETSWARRLGPSPASPSERRLFKQQRQPEAGNAQHTPPRGWCVGSIGPLAGAYNGAWRSGLETLLEDKHGFLGGQVKDKSSKTKAWISKSGTLNEIYIFVDIGLLREMKLSIHFTFIRQAMW